MIRRRIQKLSCLVVSVAMLGAVGVGLDLAAAPAGADTVGPITFETPTYSVGSVNGQDGWSSTGSYDQAVANNTGYAGAPYAGFGTQSLRISDAVTSGSFGDQTFSKPVVNAAGEPGADTGGFPAGTLQTHFQTSFDFASTTPAAEQHSPAGPGCTPTAPATECVLHLSVSPDRGDGARMSYVRIEDSPTGWNLFFDDTTDNAPLATPGNLNHGCGSEDGDSPSDSPFREIQIASGVSRTKHTLTFLMNLMPGGHGNDVVNIQLDGTTIATGTSWEDYYRYCAESGGGDGGALADKTRIVRDVEFREGGDSNTNDAGKGFLIDNFSASTQPLCTTVCYVDAVNGNDGDTGTSPATAFKTVQFGVNAVSPGGTLHVASGTYTEQVLVNKAVTITGAGQGTTTIQGPAAMTDSSCIPLTPDTSQPTRSVVTICGSTGSTVTMSGVTISGGATGEDADASCTPLITGIWVSDAETLNISQSTVTNVYNSAGPSLWGCQQGIGIRAGSDALGLKGNLIADNLTVLKYQKGGIVVDGSGSSTTITNSTIEGDQLAGLSPTIAMNGVEIARGASGSISSSTVSGNECDHPSCGSNPLTQTQSGGILLFNSLGESPVPAVSVTGNNVTGNDIGIYSDELTGSATISGNTVNANRYEGLYLDEGTASVTNNSITNNGAIGVIAAQGDFNSQADVTATLTGNTISGNPTGIEAVDACPGVGCPGPGGSPVATPNTTDAFTVHLTANRNSIAGNPTIGASNVTPGPPQSSTFNATCNWWGSASGPGPVGPGTGDKVSTGVTFAGWLLTSDLNGPCPGPPTIVTVASHGTDGISVYFTPGPNDGSPFTSFTATCVSLIGKPTISATGTTSPIVVTGAVSGTPYSCTVTETNGVGTSGPSGSSPVVYPAVLPGGGGGTGSGCSVIPTAPRTPSAASEAFPGAAVSWAPPISGCIAGYIVTPYLNGVAQTPTLVPGKGTTTVIRGLTAGATYTFTVAAENGAVAGPASPMTAAITIGAPTAASAVTAAKVGKGSLKISFVAAHNNGAAIKTYTATCTSSNGGKTKTKSGAKSPLTTTGLSTGHVYRCTVKATNSRGTGPQSKASAAVKA